MLGFFVGGLILVLFMLALNNSWMLKILKRGMSDLLDRVGNLERAVGLSSGSEPAQTVAAPPPQAQAEGVESPPLPITWELKTSEEALSD